MHIPDGYLDLKTAAATATLAAGGLGIALAHARRTLAPRRVPLMGLAAAFVFAAQMVNFPVLGGTSGHLIGAVLTAVLLGPSAAVIVMSAVLIVQCFMFSDGGVSALGANIFNMAVVASASGYAIYWAMTKVLGGLRGQVLAAAFAAWCATVLAAVCCTGELATARTVPWSLALPTMAGLHMLIGIGEAVITALVIAAIARTRPELLENTSLTPAPTSRQIALGSTLPAIGFGLVISFGIALFLSPLASKWPDGLDATAEHLGFASRAATQPVVAAPLPEYKLPGIHNESLATAIAGAIGTLIVFLLSFVLARMLVPAAAKSKIQNP